MYSFGDVLVINFPFSDGQASKRRPVMVIKDTKDGDVLVAKVTSQSYANGFDISLRDWQAAGLISPSTVRVHKIQTIAFRLLFGQIGKLTSADRGTVKQALTRLLADL